MATIKSFTSLEQSKKLAEILPFESADMHYNNISIKGINYVDEHRAELMEYNRAIKILSKYTINPLFKIIPCWSLAALLSVLPSVITREGKRMFLTLEKAGAYNLYYKSPDRLDELWETKEDVVDACYEIIIKLYELKML